MTKAAAIAAHTALIDALSSVTTTDELTSVLATITSIEEPGRAPGFPNNSADGSYFNGVHFATFIGGQTAMTAVGDLSDDTHQLWDQIQRRERDAAYAAADAQRAEVDADRGRGRPEIGRRVEVRLPEWMITMVDQYADDLGLTRPEAIRTLIAAGHQARKATA